MNKHVKYSFTLILGAAVIYLTYPPTPVLKQQPNETIAQYSLRYELEQAKPFLYEWKYLGQRWRGTSRLNEMAEEAPLEYKIKALTELFEYYRYDGLPKAAWLTRSWHEPLPRKQVEKASKAALRLAEIAPEKAAELMAEFIIYPVTVPAIPDEAIDLVRTQAEAGMPIAVEAMATYCTADRYWHPCTTEEKTKWQDAQAMQANTTQSE